MSQAPTTRLTLRLPKELAGQLHALAQRNSRSLNGEIVHQLRTHQPRKVAAPQSNKEAKT